MNQILYTIEDKNSQNKLKSTLLFFVICIIVFGIILTGMGGYNLVTAKIERDKQIELARVPEIKLTMQNNKVQIDVDHTRNIKTILYNWNDEEQITLTENKSNKISETVEVPAGTNTLNVVAIDEKGKFSKVEQKFSYDGTYMDLSVLDNKKIKIAVTDVNGLQSVTYKWNSEEEVVKYPESFNSKTLEITSDIPIGLNTILVTAINNKNEKQTKEMSVQGITKPTAKVNYSEDRTFFVLRLTDAQGIESYSYTLYYAPVEEVAKDNKLIENFKEKLTKDKSEEIKANGELEINNTDIKLKDGFNYLQITVKNVEGAEETISGWCVK